MDVDTRLGTVLRIGFVATGGGTLALAWPEHSANPLVAAFAAIVRELS